MESEWIPMEERTPVMSPIRSDREKDTSRLFGSFDFLSSFVQFHKDDKLSVSYSYCSSQNDSSTAIISQSLAFFVTINFPLNARVYRLPCETHYRVVKVWCGIIVT